MSQHESHAAGRVDDCPACAAAQLPLPIAPRRTAPTVEQPPGLEPLLAWIRTLDTAARIRALNEVRTALHAESPFRNEPVDCVVWVPTDAVTANDYNPNSVAPPEMALLALSIGEDGYTQPVVAWGRDGAYEVVDGFHRNRVCREVAPIRERVLGHLPLAVINSERTDRGDRIASTIRHNRARGKHSVNAMSDIVVELKRRNWSDEKIGRELGMDPDEVLRLTQISGLAELFSDQEFSMSWDIDNPDVADDFIPLDDETTDDEPNG